MRNGRSKSNKRKPSGGDAPHEPDAKPNPHPGLAVLLILALICVAATGYRLLTPQPAFGPSSTIGVAHGNPPGPASAPTVFSIVPEYDRTLKRVVISLAGPDASLGLHHELLMRFPRYTDVILLVEKANLKAIRAEAEGRPYRDRLILVPYDAAQRQSSRVYCLFSDSDKLVELDTQSPQPVSQHGSVWAQDLFEVTRSPSGVPVLLASDVHKYYVVGDDHSPLRVMRDNIYLSRLNAVGLEVRPTPIAFKGGNVLVDNVAGSLIAFVGGDVLRMTRAVRRAFDDVNASDVQLSNMIKDALHVQTVVAVGRGGVQPELMYHLDQAVTLLPGRVAAVTRLVPDGAGPLPDAKRFHEVESFLYELRAVLRTLGYKLVDIETTPRNLERFQHYVNAIPYVDAQSGRRTILMPVFPADQTAHDRRIIARNTAVLESCGYRVIPVPTQANELHGAIHCLVNVLE